MIKLYISTKLGTSITKHSRNNFPNQFPQTWKKSKNRHRTVHARNCKLVRFFSSRCSDAHGGWGGGTSARPSSCNVVQLRTRAADARLFSRRAAAIRNARACLSLSTHPPDAGADGSNRKIVLRIGTASARGYGRSAVDR